MKTIVLAIVAFTSCAFAQDKPQAAPAAYKWVVRYTPNTLDSIAAIHGNCHVYVQRDGMIRLNTSADVVGWAPGKLFHDITLKSSGKTMVVANEHWTPERGEQLQRVSPGFVGQDEFWENCGKALSSLPVDVLKAFKGWHGLSQEP